MSTARVLRRSWQIMWRYRALWVLGMALALYAGNTIYMDSRHEQQQPQPNNIHIILPNHTTIQMPGEGATVDLSTPGNPRVILTEGGVQREDLFLSQVVRQIRLPDLLGVGIEIVLLLVLMAAFGMIARYVAETAVIRTVDEAESTGVLPTLRTALQLGWSVRALRLFLMDLAVVLIIIASLGTLLPIFAGWATAVSLFGPGGILLAIFGALPLLGASGLALLCLALLVSLIMQPARRACAIDGLGVFASLRAGVAMLRRNLRDVGVTWVIWMGIRIVWAPLGVLAAVILAPILLVSLLAGVVLGALVTGVVAACIGPLVHSALPWVMGGIAGLPVLLLVTILPLLLVSGWVELYKSNMWTLTYRELRGMESTLAAAQPNRPLNPAQGAAD
jgi:hypothetical protein